VIRFVSALIAKKPTRLLPNLLILIWSSDCFSSAEFYSGSLKTFINKNAVVNIRITAVVPEFTSLLLFLIREIMIEVILRKIGFKKVSSCVGK
jgi:hypothetical protein